MTNAEKNSSPRPRFRTPSRQETAASDPEALFGELPRTARGVGALWSHQADQLRTYFESHRDTPDVALELPTGSGKTLVGLLISDWRRRTLGHRVVYACPTKQLVLQVLDKALAQGISAVALCGPHAEWSQAEVARYARGEAIAITTYSAIFNVNSYLGDAQTLVFDDAHSAENFVADAWAVAVEWDGDIYERLFDTLVDAVEPSFVSRMLAPDGPATDFGEVRLLPIQGIAQHAAELEKVLSNLKGDASFHFRMVRSNLSSCLFYASRSHFYIRPMIPPTFQHNPFVDPSQRVYLSATLGDAGELERAFGRKEIARVPVPPAWERTGSGRRFFVFPSLSTPEPMSSPGGVGSLLGEAEALAALMNLADKRLVLTPDDDSARRLADTLGVPPFERFTAKDTAAGIQPFLDAKRGTLLAANRYDGMDLAGDACRMVIMAGLPGASHLQDRFLSAKLRASEVLDERVRTRVLQGAGRCTRGPRDWAVVVVSGEDIVRFLSRAEVRKSLPVEMQAEIEFGLAQSQIPIGDLVLLAESALLQDEIWLEDAEPALAKLRRDSERVPAPDAMELKASARREVRAWELAWKQDWKGAALEAMSVLEHLSAPNLRPYRALWSYLGSAWFGLASTHDGDNDALRSAELLEAAHRSAVGTTWLKEVQRLPSAQLDSEPVDRAAVGAVTSLLGGGLRSSSAFDRRSARMLADLRQVASKPYEVALAELGTFLGAESFKPPGKGRADAVWIWENYWITVEAKSEQQAHNLLSMDSIRQTNTQLDLLAADRELEQAPPGSISVIASPRRVVDPDAVSIAAHNVYLVTPKVMLDLAHSAVRAWKSLRGLAQTGGEDAVHREVARILWENRVLPTQVREQLTRDPIRGS